MTTFNENLNFGLAGESKIASWLLIERKCNSILPAYEVEINRGKGPRLFLAKKNLVTPDMLIFGEQKMFWAEAKRKESFTWYRIGSSWQDGIDLHHWNEYKKVKEETGLDVWLFFLHDKIGGRAKDTPEGKLPPLGLFGQEVDILDRRVDHVSSRHGRHGMVYWDKDVFINIATLWDVDTAHTERQLKAAVS